MKGLTLGVKTFDRPARLQTLLESVRKFYPDLPIAVADDGHQSAKDVCLEYGAQHFSMTFDSGLSAGRNLLVDHTKTERILIADDDFIFTEQTDLARFCSELRGYDILGGALYRPDGTLQRYEGLMEQVGSELRLYRPNPTGTCPMHIVLNFLCARVKTLKQVRWYEPLKMIEHEDFFWRCRIAGVRVGYCPSVSCTHVAAQQTAEYQRFRNRSAEFREIVRRRWGWQSVVWRVAA